MCRVGSCHVNMSTGQNLRRDVNEKESDSTAGEVKEEPKAEGRKGGEEGDTNAQNTTATVNEQNSESTEKPLPGTVLNHHSDIMNVLSKGTQILLRKNKYPFVCKRHFEVAKEKKGKVKEEGAHPPDVRSSNSNSNSISVDKPALPPRERKLIDFRNKVYVAPLTTVGNLPFRRIMKRYGADITCGEMALSDQLLSGKPHEWALLKRHPSEDIFGVQIAAGHADQYTRVAELISNEPGMEIDFLDMNLGCPIDLVCERGAGASLMLREKKLRESLEGMLSVLNCPVTVKMRTGWVEEKPIAHRLVPKIQSWGIDGIGAVMVRPPLRCFSRPSIFVSHWRVCTSCFERFMAEVVCSGTPKSLGGITSRR